MIFSGSRISADCISDGGESERHLALKHTGQQINDEDSGSHAQDAAFKINLLTVRARSVPEFLDERPAKRTNRVGTVARSVFITFSPLANGDRLMVYCSASASQAVRI